LGGYDLKTEASENPRLISLVSGVLVGYAITCIIFLAYSMLITYTSLSEDNMSLVVAGVTLVSVIVAGFDAARGADNKGWLWGILAGLVYAVILLIIMALVLRGLTFDSHIVTILVLSIAGGGLGGVIGINFAR
jgi:putative membrane protein (TIGR04086 family)